MGHVIPGFWALPTAHVTRDTELAHRLIKVIKGSNMIGQNKSVSATHVFLKSGVHTLYYIKKIFEYSSNSVLLLFFIEIVTKQKAYPIE